MSESKPKPGAIVWHDLTVDHAEQVRDFYQAVLGWESQGLDMDGYQDYCVGPSGQDAIAGVCHRRGCNEKVPPQWLTYFAVPDLAACVSRVLEQGGSVVDGPRGEGDGSFCIVKDPAGAVCGLYQTATEP